MLGIAREQRELDSRVTNRDARRFVHRSQSDDGNPSYAIWTWEVTPVDGVSELTVRWEGHPETFWRRVLFSRIRSRQLESETRRSLEAVARAVTSPFSRSSATETGT